MEINGGLLSEEGKKNMLDNCEFHNIQMGSRLFDSHNSNDDRKSLGIFGSTIIAHDSIRRMESN